GGLCARFDLCFGLGAEVLRDEEVRGRERAAGEHDPRERERDARAASFARIDHAQRRRDLIGAGVPALWLLLETTQDHRLERGWTARRQLRRLWWRRVRVLHQILAVRARREWVQAGHQLEQQHAERVDIGARIDGTAHVRLLGRHVLRGTDDAALALKADLRDAKVDQLHEVIAAIAID